MNGSPVTGVSTGTSGTNCWGSGQSQGYEADVTALVSDDGTYALTGLGGTAGDNVNGASLVVLYNDAISTNNRGVVFYTGNDSTHQASHLGDPDGWQAALPGVKYSASGDIKAILHVADGQNAPDMPLTFSTESGSLPSPTPRNSTTATLFHPAALPAMAMGCTTSTPSTSSPPSATPPAARRSPSTPRTAKTAWRWSPCS